MSTGAPPTALSAGPHSSRIREWKNRRWFRLYGPALITGGVIFAHPRIKLKKKDQNLLYGLSGNAWCNGRGRKKILPGRYWYGNRPQLLQSSPAKLSKVLILAIESRRGFPSVCRPIQTLPNRTAILSRMLCAGFPTDIELPPTATRYFGYTVFMPDLSGTAIRLNLGAARRRSVSKKESTGYSRAFV